jgi:hypothetical protein
MYNNRKTQRKKGGSFLTAAKQATRRGINFTTNKIVSATSNVKKSIKGDRIKAIYNGTKVQTFCCETNKDVTESSNPINKLNIFGKNNGSDCVPSYSGQCNITGKHTHKFRCFDAKYYPTPSKYPDKFPDFPSPNHNTDFNDKLFNTLVANGSPNTSDLKINITKLMNMRIEFVQANSDIKTYLEKYKDVLRLPTLEEFKNSKKQANTKWYDIISTSSGRNTKIKQVHKPDIDTMLRKLNDYAKHIQLKQLGLRCSRESAEVYAKFGVVHDITIPNKSVVGSSDKQTDEDGTEYETEEDSKHVIIYKKDKSGVKKPVYEYTKKLEPTQLIHDGKVSKYLNELNTFLHLFSFKTPILYENS